MPQKAEVISQVRIQSGAPLPNKTGHSGRICASAHHEPFEDRPATDDSDFRIVNLHLIDH